MGSGDRVTFYPARSFGLGVSVSRFPFALTFTAHLLLWGVSVGFGKGYDQ